MLFTDDYTVDKSSLHRTKDGYLAGISRVARTGIQIYSGKEMGRPDLERVRVYRPEDEVFAPDTIRSYARKPITINHPSDPVNSKSWKDKAVGNLGEEVLRDGGYVHVPWFLMDERAIQTVDEGQNQLSMGYTCDVEWGEGVTPGGEQYDATQKNIRINHMAIVKNARGGDMLRIGDAEYALDESRGDYVVQFDDGTLLTDIEKIEVKSGNPWRNPDGTMAVSPEGGGGGGGGGGGAGKAVSTQTSLFRGSTDPAPTVANFPTAQKAREYLEKERRKWARAKITKHAHLTYGKSGIVRRLLRLGPPVKSTEIRYELRAGHQRREEDGQNIGDFVCDESRDTPTTTQDNTECPHCGYDVPSGEETCPECGYKMETEDGDAVKDEGEIVMPKTIVVDGISCEMSDTAAQVVQRTLDRLEKAVKDNAENFEEYRKKKKEEEEKAATDAATVATLKATQDAEIATLKKQLADAQVTPQQLDAMVSDRVAVITKARAILGDRLAIDGKTSAEIRRQVVDANLGDVSKGWTDEQVSASFGTLTSKITGNAGAIGDGVSDLARGFSFPTNVQDKREDAYAAYDAALSKSWQGGGKAA